MSTGMADIIAAHSPIGVDPESWDLGAQTRWRCFGCGAAESAESAPNHDVTKSIWHGAHVAEELTKAGYGNVQEAQAEALTDAADWLLNGETAGIIAYDGPSNRGEVTDAYDAALEDPESWLRERAEAALIVDPADPYREPQPLRRLASHRGPSCCRPGRPGRPRPRESHPRPEGGSVSVTNRLTKSIGPSSVGRLIPRGCLVLDREFITRSYIEIPKVDQAAGPSVHLLPHKRLARCKSSATYRDGKQPNRGMSLICEFDALFSCAALRGEPHGFTGVNRSHPRFGLFSQFQGFFSSSGLPSGPESTQSSHYQSRDRYPFTCTHGTECTCTASCRLEP